MTMKKSIDQKNDVETDSIEILYKKVTKIEHTLKYISRNEIMSMMELDYEPKFREALYYCFLKNDVDLARHIIENCNVDFSNYSFDGIPIEYLNNPGIIKLLLDNGHIWTKSIMHKLLIVPEIIKLLLELGVDLRRILKFNNKDVTKEVIDLFVDEIKKSNTFIEKDLLSLILVGNYEHVQLSLDQIKILVDSGADPRYNQYAALVFSSGYGNIDAVKYFLYECDCDVDAQRSYALGAAIKNKHFEVANLLIEFGIKITDDAIVMSFVDQKYISLFLKRGISAERIGKLLWNEIKKLDNAFEDRCDCFMDQCDISGCAEELVKHGVDFNQIILG